jgi:hypothetical protein
VLVTYQLKNDMRLTTDWYQSATERQERPLLCAASDNTRITDFFSKVTVRASDAHKSPVIKPLVTRFVESHDPA